MRSATKGERGEHDRVTKPTCDDLEAENAAQLEARSARLAERVREVDARKNGC